MIHYFNPGHETAVLNASPYYTAPANITAMMHDLAFLPAWYASAGDYIFLEESIDAKYMSYLRKRLNLQTINITAKSNLEIIENDEVCPWGISPQSIQRFHDLNQKYYINTKVPKWREEYVYLNSREAAKDCLKKIIENEPCISNQLLPRFVDNLGDIEQAVKASQSQLLIKAPYSSSGRGLLWLPLGELTRTERQIINGLLNKQKKVSLEQALDKQLDFAMEFMSDGVGHVDFVGYSLFETSNRGVYEGNHIMPQTKIEDLLSKDISKGLLDEMRSSLSAILSEMYGMVYKGCIGVDMLIYKEGGEYKLHPCVEINMRYNMGYLSYMLAEHHISPSSEGRFSIKFNSTEGEVFAQHREMLSKYPAIFSNNRLQSGYLPLCPVSIKSRYWAYVLVG